MDENQLDAYLESLSEDELAALYTEVQAELTQEDQPEVRVPSELETFTDEAVDPLALGYGSELAAGTRAITDDVLRGFGKLGIGPYGRVMGTEAEQYLPETGYEAIKQDVLAERAAGKEANPRAALGGTALGIGTSLATGSMAGKALKGAGRLGQALTGTAKGRIASGAGIGAAYNPGELEEGESELAARARNAAIGGGLGVAGEGVRKFVSGPARRSRMVSRLKKGDLGEELSGELNKVRQAITENVVKPTSRQARKILEGKTVDINPDRLKGISPGLDRYAETIAKKIPKGSSRATVAGPRAQRLKQVLGRRADFKPSDVYNPSIGPKIERAGVANRLMGEKLAEVNPELVGLNKQMQEAITLRDAFKRVKKPIQKFKSIGVGKDEYEWLKKMDDMVGSDLTGISDDVTQADGLIFKKGLKTALHPLEWINSGVKATERTVGRAGRGIEAAQPATTKASLMSILEGLREKENKDK